VKTEVIMNRPFMDVTIRQMSKSGYFCATDITSLYNSIRVTQGKAPKEMDKYFVNKENIEFMDALCKELNLLENEVKFTRRGKDNCGTWMHPQLFLRYVNWLSPALLEEAQALCGEKPSHFISKRREDTFSDFLTGFVGSEVEIIRQYPVDIYRLDFYLPQYHIGIEYDEIHHKKQRAEDAVRQAFIESILECKIIRVDMENEGAGLRRIGNAIDGSEFMRTPQNRVFMAMNHCDTMIGMLHQRT